LAKGAIPEETDFFGRRFHQTGWRLSGESRKLKIMDNVAASRQSAAIWNFRNATVCRRSATLRIFSSQKNIVRFGVLQPYMPNPPPNLQK
jgi:hypothetical protein